MALTGTSLAAAIGLNDTQIKVTAPAGFAKGNLIRVDDEIMQQSGDLIAPGNLVPVIRGLEGTVQTTHPLNATVVVGLGEDFPKAGAGSASPVAFPLQSNRPVFSYSAAGALQPLEGLHILNGPAVQAMTLASPTLLQNGDVMEIVGLGALAHTVTYTPGLGGGGAGVDVLTFPAAGRASVRLVAASGFWVPCPSPFTGTLTNIAIGIA